MPPTSMRRKVFELAHEGHLGQILTKQRVRENFWWPEMDREIGDWVEECVECKEGEKRLKVGNQGMCGEIENHGQAWHTVCVDFIGPFDDLTEDIRFALVMVDVHSKWLVVKFIHEITTAATIKMSREIFMEEGYRSKLVTDNSTHWCRRK